MQRTVLPATPFRRRVDRTATSDAINSRGWSSPWTRSGSPPAIVSARDQAIAQRRWKVALLVEEEGLERGAMTRIAGWLSVSPSTIYRDIQALLAAENPIVLSAVARENRRKAHQNQTTAR